MRMISPLCKRIDATNSSGAERQASLAAEREDLISEAELDQVSAAGGPGTGGFGGGGGGSGGN